MKQWAVLAAHALWLVSLSGCNPCEQAHGDAAAAWEDVSSFARDVAAWWGKTEVEEGAKGHYGVPEQAAEQREKWLKAHRVAMDALSAVRTSGGRSRPAEVTRAVDELTNLEPPRPYAEWPTKLRTASEAVDRMARICPASK